jgi:lipoprotein-anchoring transpeptidase ErfK/SrfK
MLAVGGAAAVTVVTVAGGLGIGPGAAMASTTPRASASSDPPTVGAGAGAGASAGRSSSGGGRSWLTIDRDASRVPSGQDDGGSQEIRPHPDAGGEPAAPAIPASSGHGRRVVFDQSDQRVWLVDARGEPARTYLVSGSLHDNLQPGSYAVYSKSLHTVSFDGRETMRYMVRFTQGEHAPIGFHDIPRRPDGTMVETRDQLGTPQSAGCVRQWEPDAKALWRFAPVGTKVVVVA